MADSAKRLPKPSRDALEAARTKTVDDVIRPGLGVLFCGINPSLYSAAVGAHFARPGNRFWPALAAAGLIPGDLTAADQERLLEYGFGITNFVERATARADELSADEILAGAGALEAKIARFVPRALAVLGIGAYRQGFERPAASLGRQPERMGNADVWVLPNPSGLNAHYRLEDLAELYSQLGVYVERGKVS